MLTATAATAATPVAAHTPAVSVLLYSLLTILFTVAGATFVVIPK